MAMPLPAVPPTVAATTGLYAALLHGYGLLLLASRAAHAFGVARSPERLGWRLAAMVITCNLLAGGALLLLVAWLRA